MQPTITIAYRLAWWAKFAAVATLIVMLPFVGEKRAGFVAAKVFCRGCSVTAR